MITHHSSPQSKKNEKENNCKFFVNMESFSEAQILQIRWGAQAYQLELPSDVTVNTVKEQLYSLTEVRLRLSLIARCTPLHRNCVVCCQMEKYLLIQRN
jgi:hypothetical protein